MGLLVAVNHTGLMSGAETVLVRALVGAKARGWQVISVNPCGPLTERLLAAGIECEPIPELVLPSGRRSAAFGRLAARTFRAIRQVRRVAAPADLVLGNGLRCLPVLRLASPQAPVVLLEHTVVRRREWNLLLPACASAVELVVCVSQAVSDAVAAWPGFAGTRTAVVRNGTPWPVAPVSETPPRPPVIGCAALLTPWKGQDVLLEAMVHLGRDEVVLELLGGSFPKDGEYVASLRRRAASPDLAGRVRFLGHLDDPLQRMRGWSVAVNASTDPEAGPLAVLEAMSIGLPVVAMDQGGPPEILGEAGLLVPPADADAMAAAIARLLDDQDLRRRCSRAGRELVAAGLTLESQIQSLVDLFDHTVSIGRQSTGAAAALCRRLASARTSSSAAVVRLASKWSRTR